MGVIDDPYVGDLITNRFAGLYAEDSKFAAMAGRFFVRIGLVGLTNAQRRSSMRILSQYLSELSNDYINGDAKQKRIAGATLQFDYGVHSDNLDMFTKHMVQSLENDFAIPNADDMVDVDGNLSELGHVVAVAMNRATDMAVQNPKASDRPRWAEHPLGRIVYGITGFARAFTRNVILFSAHKAKREKMLVGESFENGEIKVPPGKLNSTVIYYKTLAPLATLFIAHTAFSVIREVALGSKDLEELEEEEGYEGLLRYFGLLGLSRSGLTGALDVFYNAA